MPRQSTLRCHPVSLLTVWGLVVGVGMLLVGDYAARPGVAASAPARWPAESLIRRDGRRPTLLIFLHPRCPCSRASVAELASISSDCGDRVSIQAVLLQPGEGREGWGQSEIEADLADLPRLRIRSDRGGGESRRFGVSTSGHVLLYDPEGRLIFSGGITPRAAIREPMKAGSPCGPGSLGPAEEARTIRSSAARWRRLDEPPARDLHDEPGGDDDDGDDGAGRRAGRRPVCRASGGRLSTGRPALRVAAHAGVDRGGRVRRVGLTLHVGR